MQKIWHVWQAPVDHEVLGARVCHLCEQTESHFLKVAPGRLLSKGRVKPWLSITVFYELGTVKCPKS